MRHDTILVNTLSETEVVCLEREVKCERSDVVARGIFRRRILCEGFREKNVATFVDRRSRVRATINDRFDPSIIAALRSFGRFRSALYAPAAAAACQIIYPLALSRPQLTAGNRKSLLISERFVAVGRSVVRRYRNRCVVGEHRARTHEVESFISSPFCVSARLAASV